MTNQEREQRVEHNLIFILAEMEVQIGLANNYPEGGLSFAEEMAQMSEYIHTAGEYGLAYESIIANLETVPFKLSGVAAVRLLEAGLILGFKTERDEDKAFDFRAR